MSDRIAQLATHLHMRARIHETLRDGEAIDYAQVRAWAPTLRETAEALTALEAELATMTELRDLAVADLFPVCEEREALRAALVDIATFGKKNTGYGYSCAGKARAALDTKEGA